MTVKFTAPKVIVTPGMIQSGEAVMAKCMDQPEGSISDGEMLIGVYLAMHATYWAEIEQTHKRKQSGSPILKPTNLILPGQTH